MNTITTEQLRERLESGSHDFVLLDVIDQPAYNFQHLPQAINIPLEELDHRAYKVLPKNKEIIIYCDTKNCSDAIAAARQLQQKGYDHLTVLDGGLSAWIDAQYPLRGETAQS